MIKGQLNINNVNTLLIGLTGENITRLVANEPILFNAKEAGLFFPSLSITITYGKTEQDILNQIEEITGG